MSEVNEIIISSKYRQWDSENEKWKNYSFWNKASDTECDDGSTVEEKLGSVSQKVDNSISDAYDKTETYAVGDLCIYDEKIYKCITAIETAEEFDSTKWEQTNVGTELKSLNQSLTLDFSNASSDVQNINTLLQNLLDKFYPKLFNFITDTNNTWWGGNMDTITYNGSTIVMQDTGRDNSIRDFYAYMKTPVTLKGDNPVLTFDAKCSAGSGGASSYSFNLEISKDGSNWTSLINQQKSLNDYGTVSAELNCSEKSLMDYAGEKVYFKLRVSASNNLYGGAVFTINKFELP